MKIALRQLEASLRKELAPLYTVHGAEALLVLEAADRIREAARKAGATEREVFFAEPGVDWNRLSASGANLSLFASRRLVEIRKAKSAKEVRAANSGGAYTQKKP